MQFDLVPFIPMALAAVFVVVYLVMGYRDDYSFEAAMFRPLTCSPDNSHLSYEARREAIHHQGLTPATARDFVMDVNMKRELRQLILQNMKVDSETLARIIRNHARAKHKVWLWDLNNALALFIKKLILASEKREKDE